MAKSTRDLLNQRLSEIPLTDERAAEIIQQLEEEGFPTSLLGVDGEKINPPLLDYGLRLISQYNDPEDEDFNDIEVLKVACACGNYDALFTYAELLLSDITSEKTTDEKRVELIQEINEDLKEICNLYWSEGYLIACRILRALSEIYQTTLKDQEGSGALSTLFFDESVSCYLNAIELLHFAPSQHLVKLFHHVTEVKEEDWKVFTKPEGEIVAKLSVSEPTHYMRLFTESRKHLHDELIKNHDPSIKLRPLNYKLIRLSA
jgi:hypothetical protein